MTRPRPLLRLAIILCVTASTIPSAIASGTGIPTFGSPILGTGRAITRQIVHLKAEAGRLIGSPSMGSVAMIVANAPGCGSSDIVIRERRAEGDSILIQTVGPACLQKNLVQATLFLREAVRRVRFAKSDKDGWMECRLESMPVPISNVLDHSARLLPAVVVNDLGLIQLLREKVGGSSPAELRPPWTADAPTRIGRATWHFLWAAVALVMFVALSWSVHKTATLRARN